MSPPLSHLGKNIENALIGMLFSQIWMVLLFSWSSLLFPGVKTTRKQERGKRRTNRTWWWLETLLQTRQGLRLWRQNQRRPRKLSNCNENNQIHCHCILVCKVHYYVKTKWRLRQGSFLERMKVMGMGNQHVFNVFKRLLDMRKAGNLVSGHF